MANLPRVAQTVWHFCGACNKDTYHRVLTHLSPSSAKLACDSCKRKATLRLGPTGLRSASGKSSVKRKPADQLSWVSLQNRLSTHAPTPYAPTTKFQVDTAVQHPVFGVGFVTEAGTSKIQVVFRDGVKQLIHNQ